MPEPITTQQQQQQQQQPADDTPEDLLTLLINDTGLSQTLKRSAARPSTPSLQR